MSSFDVAKPHIAFWNLCVKEQSKLPDTTHAQLSCIHPSPVEWSELRNGMTVGLA